MALWRKLTMFGRTRTLVAVATVALSCAASPVPAMQLSEGLAQLYSSVSINPPSADRITICYGFVCRRRYVFDFTPADRKRRVVYDTGHNLPQNEAVKETLDWLDRELGPVRP